MSKTGTQRFISVAIGGLAALALVIALMLVFATTQPHRAAEEALMLSDPPRLRI
jgi:hypothetical protein